ncbi:MAG: hypothetical protein V4689_18430 [Verrucomicrobiota bacterium]
MRGILFLLLTVAVACAAPKKVAVFVSLCDNATQGIVPVPAKIGDGNRPETNLYWGCSDGFAGCFRASKTWKLQRKEVPEDKRIFERLVYQHESGNIELTAEAWRGSEIKACLTAFEAALVSGNHDLCAYVGHNVLMDGEVPPPAHKLVKPCDAIVLCCMSENYFKDRLVKLGAKPVILTTQLMYPGSFILRDALPLWAEGRPPEELRQAAAAAYSRNQGISKKAAAGVFFKFP